VFARAAESNEVILNVLNDVILVNIDCEKGEGIELAKKYGVRGYPTFLMANAKGEVTDGMIGYPGPENWVDFVKDGDKDRRTIEDKKAAYEKAPTKELACALATHASTSYDFPGAVKYFQKARELDPANSAVYSKEILTFMYYGSRGGAFTLDQVEAEAKLAASNPQATPDGLVSIANMVSGIAQQAGQPEKAIPFIKKALKASHGVEDLADARLNPEITAALLIDHDTDKAVALKRKSMGDGWQVDSGALNEFAWWCFENNANLAEAEEMALKGAELAATDSERANILDTAAEICNARGNCDEAIARIKEAIELDPEKGFFKDQLARFEKILADKKG